MATAGAASVSQKREEFEEEFLTCSICTELYNKEEYRAKVLPCLHTFCKSCLVKHAQRQAKFDCPKCRCEVTMPRGGVDKLRNNFMVENLKDYQDIFESRVVCGSCTAVENQAQMFCYNCHCFLCRNCVDAHEQLGPISEHVLVSIAELQRKRHNPMMQQHQQCKKHPNQDLTLYCKDANCKVLVCASCCHVNHRGHHLVELATATEEIKADLRQSSQKVQKRSKELTKTRAKTESLQKRLTDDLEKKQMNMQECEQALIKLIKDKFSKADRHYYYLYELERKDLQEKLESIDSLMAQMISACDFASKACEVSSPTQLVDSRNQIKDRLSELENIRLPKADAAYKTNFNFTDKHDLALQQIRWATTYLCDVPESSTWMWLCTKMREVLPYAGISILVGISVLIAYLSDRARMRRLAPKNVTQVRPNMIGCIPNEENVSSASKPSTILLNLSKKLADSIIGLISRR